MQPGVVLTRVLARNRETDPVRGGQLSREAGTGPSWTEPAVLQAGRMTWGGAGGDAAAAREPRPGQRGAAPTEPHGLRAHRRQPEAWTSKVKAPASAWAPSGLQTVFPPCPPVRGELGTRRGVSSGTKPTCGAAPSELRHLLTPSPQGPGLNM